MLITCQIQAHLEVSGRFSNKISYRTNHISNRNMIGRLDQAETLGGLGLI